ncbi:MAG: NAD-dependent epimerase/dehydratase family protein [Deltaproteobacteria bacterium]|nr:NAD-dependent epimerase/dehydratase family protein [Deltaproteobacteria bacterium]
MNKILVTGASGFIGTALCSQLAPGNKLIGVDVTKALGKSAYIEWEQADLSGRNSVAAICEKYSPDVVIHCAGIAHQKIGAVSAATYMRVNSEATENLAKAASKVNPNVVFIFFSSVSVYGEGRLETGISEYGECRPSSDYAVSKLDAERRLRAIYDEGKLHNLVILRLAPVYDREWSLNLDRRVFAPGKLAYLRFGPGSQRMSALARPNLVEFIDFLIHRFRRLTQINANENNIKNNRTRQNNLCNRCNLRINVCDPEPYEFNRIIQVFKRSGIRPKRPVISVPLSPVWLGTRIAGSLLTDKREWIHSCYDKVAGDLVFSNKKMLETGYTPLHNLESIFLMDG